MENTNVIIDVKNLIKIFKMDKEKIVAINDISFQICEGEICCLFGKSGCGKSTLLNLLSGIEKTTSGVIKINNYRIDKMSEKKLAKFRQKYLSFIFQSYNLLPQFTAIENVELPLVFKGVNKKVRQKKAIEMLKHVDLGERLEHRPSQMSGGQQQRVGIARAFVSSPKIIFADEPTGNLDTKTTDKIMQLILNMSKEKKLTVVMVTHDASLLKYADKIINMEDGKITGITTKN